MPTLRVLLVEDHATVRQGLKLLIDGQPDMTVVAEAGDGAAALEMARGLAPDVVVMDIAMPRMNGLAATRALKASLPAIAVVALTRYRDEAYLQELIRAGASGYVLKQSPSTELLLAIRAAAAGGRYLDSAMTMQEAERQRLRDAPPVARTVTDREAHVLRLIALGHSNKEIAAQLDLSVKTVEVHKANGMRKLGLLGRIDIVRYAMLQGWMQGE